MGFLFTLLMQFLIDFFPIIAFFGVFQIAEKHADWIPDAVLGWFANTDATVLPMMLATVTAIVATFIQLAFYLGLKKKIEPTFWLSLIVIVIFGSLTIYFRNGLFIQWKPSILYWLFAGILFFGRVTGRNFVKTMMQKAMVEMPPKRWTQLQDLWIGALVLFGLINLGVVYTCSVETWVNFKLYGLMALTFVFTIASALFVTKYGEGEHN